MSAKLLVEKKMLTIFHIDLSISCFLSWIHEAMNIMFSPFLPSPSQFLIQFMYKINITQLVYK